MNILFLTLLDFSTIQEHTIYTDLLREFIRNGHKVCAVSPVERRKHERTRIIKEPGCRILKLRIGNTQKTHIIEKGISTLMIESQFIAGIKRYFSDIRFDLVLYATPPITLCKVVDYVKERDGAKSYLLLKDIFPQNALDLKMISKTGIRGLMYRKFRAQEEKLYACSDRIGCMSEANVSFVLKHNPEIRRRQEEALRNSRHPVVEVCANSIEPTDITLSETERVRIREQYDLPTDRTIFVYGGNLGKPQGIDFMLKCLHSQRKNENVFFLIIGNGTEYPRIAHYMERYQPQNVRLTEWLPKEDYDRVVASCDAGLIFLDHRFTIPNFPSRLLAYMDTGLPVLAVTDTATDIGKVITEGGFGWWCESNDVKRFSTQIKEIVKQHRDGRLSQYGSPARNYLHNHYTVAQACRTILNRT